MHHVDCGKLSIYELLWPQLRLRPFGKQARGDLHMHWKT